MSTILTSEELDYIDAAHKRVVSDGLFNEKRVSITLAAGASSYTLPDEVIALRGIFQGNTVISRISTGDYLTYLSGSSAESTGVIVVFAVIGRTMHLWPALGQQTTFTLIYSYRPATIDSGSDLEVSGETERLVERLAGAYELIDDGQPELGQAELAQYYADLVKLRKRHNAAGGRTRRAQVRGYQRSNAGRLANDVDVR